MKRSIIGATLILIALATTVVYHLTQQADIYYYQGHNFFIKAQYKDAIPLFRESLKYDPERVPSLSELAYAYLWSGQYQEAIPVFQKLSVLDPKNERTKKSLATAYSWNKEYSRAEEIFLATLRANPKDRDAQKELAEIYLWDQKNEKAKDLLSSLLESNPRDARAKFLYGKALLYLGQTQAAIRIFEELSKGSVPAAQGAV